MGDITNQAVSQIIYTPNMSNIYLDPQQNINIAGYQPDQVQNVLYNRTLTTEEQITFKFAVGYPAPLLTIASVDNRIAFKIFTNDNSLLSPESVKKSTNVPLDGKNGVQWQPGNGESYTIFIKNVSNNVIDADTPLVIFQCTIQNTLSQYLPRMNIGLSNMNSHAEIKRGAQPTTVEVSQICAFNTQSAQANCYVATVTNFPVRQGLLVAPINIKPLKTGTLLYAVATGNGSIAPGPAGYEDMPVTANVIITLSTKQIAPGDGSWSGTLYFGFTNVGITTQFPTFWSEVALPPFDSMLNAMERADNYSAATTGMGSQMMGTTSGFDGEIKSMVASLTDKIECMAVLMEKHFSSNNEELNMLEEDMPAPVQSRIQNRRPSFAMGFRNANNTNGGSRGL